VKFLKIPILPAGLEHLRGLCFHGGPDNLLSGRAQCAGGRREITAVKACSRQIVGSPPVAYGHQDNKLSGPPKTSRISFGALLLAMFVFGISGDPALAQNAPSGPVHLPPSSTASAATSAKPVTTSSPAVQGANSTPSAAPQSAASTEDIHDIRGPISIPYEWLWAAYVLVALVLAAALYAAWRFFRSRVKTKAKLPFEIALERLEAARELMTPDTVREYAFTVSEIIRVYIEQSFGEKAARRTTEEFLSDLLQQTGTPLAQHRALLEDFLNHCDLMKYARWGASVREMESMQESARVFILDTRPQPEPAKATTLPAQPSAPEQPELVQVK